MTPGEERDDDDDAHPTEEEVAAIAASLPDCRDCGACCFSVGENYVFLWGGDHAALTRQEQRRLTRFEGTHCFMEMEDGHCAALVNQAGRAVCSIYERRPMLCRELARGEGGCLAARERFGEAARSWLARPPG